MNTEKSNSIKYFHSVLSSALLIYKEENSADWWNFRIFCRKSFCWVEFYRRDKILHSPSRRGPLSPLFAWKLLVHFGGIVSKRQNWEIDRDIAQKKFDWTVLKTYLGGEKRGELLAESVGHLRENADKAFQISIWMWIWIRIWMWNWISHPISHSPRMWMWIWIWL